MTSKTKKFVVEPGRIRCDGRKFLGRYSAQSPAGREMSHTSSRSAGASLPDQRGRHRHQLLRPADPAGAIKAIQREIPISNTQFSQLAGGVSCWPTRSCMWAAGKLVDVLGTRTGFLLIMIWWSLACASHGLASGFGMLAVSRFLLGMGEGGGFPAATKAVAEWFPVGERSTAMGIINAGTAAGAVVAPPLDRHHARRP